MKRLNLLLLGLVVVASGCIGGQSNSGEFLSKYDTDVLQLDRTGQETKFILDKDSEQYKIQASSPLPAEEVFSDTENRTKLLKQLCRTLQGSLNQDVNGEATFDILNKEGQVLESQKRVNMTKLTEVLDRYEMSEAKYTVPNKSGEKAAECLMGSKQPDSLDVSFYDNR